MITLRTLGVPALKALAGQVATREELATLSLAAVKSIVPAEAASGALAELQALGRKGWPGAHVAVLLAEIAEAKERERALKERYQLVLSPPELDRVDARDTAAVVAELFQRAHRRLLIVTYALDKPAACEAIFGKLAERMDTDGGLEVELVVNISRIWTQDGWDTLPEDEHLKRSGRDLRDRLWPGKRLPKVFFDPRGLDSQPQQRASMHAKLIVADRARVFITSANFTEAAHARNIEAGILAHDKALAARLERQFQRLREQLVLKALPG